MSHNIFGLCPSTKIFYEHEVWGAGPIFIFCHVGDEKSEKITILMRESCILNTPGAPYFNTCLVIDFPVFFITGLLPHFASPCPARYKDDRMRTSQSSVGFDSCTRPFRSFVCFKKGPMQAAPTNTKEETLYSNMNYFLLFCSKHQ